MNFTISTVWQKILISITHTVLKKFTKYFHNFFFHLDIADGRDYTEEEVNKMLDKESEDDKDPMDTSAKNDTGINTDPPKTVSVGTDPVVPACSRSPSSSSTATTMTSSNSILPRAYANVRAARLDNCTVCPLYGSVVRDSDLGSFTNVGDGRVSLANHRHCFQTKKNISSSFTLDTLDLYNL
jgi:hypothetical protein